ncbi:hypothetical protein [Paractinoplanes hotanensis]|uniref:Uncharacterized protein n=1 Tax=Paractinoplanes hotanensis TaxID=2906497 RepID=A0ABT0Y350_9ACTN|nr:hypothetical protein [Actinoplanes hotanensis]MCM4080455.1 hypothetical protein [Actinoplanes hotanensis]
MDIHVPELLFPLSWSPAPESWAYKEGVLTVAGPLARTRGFLPWATVAHGVS